MSDILNNDTATVELEDGTEVTVPWTQDYECERIQEDRNGVLYLQEGDWIRGVGVVVVSHSWNRLAETYGGGLLGNVRNTGWTPYDSREQWEEMCEE